MKYLIPTLVILLMVQFYNALAVTNESSEPQYTQTVADGNYRHGHWCMDGRVF